MIQEVNLNEFPEFEEGGFESEAEAIEAIRVMSINPPVKRPRPFTRQIRSGNSIEFIRKSPNLDPTFNVDPDHPMDAVWEWF